MVFHSYDIEINENYIYRLLNNTKQIKIRNIKSENNVTVFTIDSDDYEELIKIAGKLKIRILNSREKGICVFLTKFSVIKAVICTVLIFLMLIVVNSKFIWKISVDGNYSYTSKQIIEYVNKNKIKEGMLKNKIDCSNLEKNIRKTYNDISWVCAEIKGTNLIIHIKENYITEISAIEKKPYNIVANKDAEIKSILVRKGQGNVKVGDKIKKGDVLISGLVDVFDESEQKIFTNACNADGEIVGKTVYKYYEKLPISYEKKVIKKEKNIYLPSIAGYKWSAIKEKKNRDIIYSEKRLKAFGNFYLPLLVQKYSVIDYENEKCEYTQKEAKNILERNLIYKLAILEQKGYKILEKNVNISKVKNHYCMFGNISFYEPLGKVEYICEDVLNQIKIESESVKEAESKK